MLKEAVLKRAMTPGVIEYGLMIIAGCWVAVVLLAFGDWTTAMSTPSPDMRFFLDLRPAAIGMRLVFQTIPLWASLSAVALLLANCMLAVFAPPGGAAYWIAEHRQSRVTQPEREIAALRIPKPGTKLGPCEERCGHVDCQLMRAQAAGLCPGCWRPIGYVTPCYEIKGTRRLVHVVCVEVRPIAGQVAPPEEA